jgi:predicted enzyme related to lactoylglutathione lyase
MALNLNSIMLGSEDSKKLADFYAKVLGPPNPDWSDEANGWFGFQAGDGSLAIGPHSDVKGRSQQPGRVMLNLETADVKGEFERIKAAGAEVVAEPYEPGGGPGMQMCTFADPDGNYFQLASPMGPETT